MNILKISKTTSLFGVAILCLYSMCFAHCQMEDNDVEQPQTPTTDAANLDGLEIPKLSKDYDYISHQLQDGTVNYSLEYDKELYHARWVAYVYDAKSAQRNCKKRTDAWKGEPFYDNDRTYQLATGTFPNGFARGHIVGSAERYYSEEANAQTFYMSNMSPMNKNFNTTYWGVVEDLVRDKWGRTIVNPNSKYYGGTLYVVKGGTLRPVKGGVQDPKLTQITVKNSLGDKVVMIVPRYYWIACLYKTPKGTYRAIGFKMEHKDYQNSSKKFLEELRKGSACSIDELEQFTGIDFFPNLPDKIEKAVESTYDLNEWNE